MEAEESGKDPPHGHSVSSVLQLTRWRLGEPGVAAPRAGRKEGRASPWGSLWAGETEAYTQQRWDLFLQPSNPRETLGSFPGDRHRLWLNPGPGHSASRHGVQFSCLHLEPQRPGSYPQQRPLDNMSVCTWTSLIALS